MSRNFYFFAIFFSVLTAICGTIQNCIALFIGFEIYNSESFIPWFLATTFVSGAGLVFVLYYFHFKKFKFSFYSGVITSLCNFALTGILLAILTLHTMQDFYQLALVAVLLTSAIYGVSLVMYPVRKHLWLRLSGMIQIFFSTAWIMMMVWLAINPEYQRNPLVEKLNGWFTLAASLIPLLYAKHFSVELKALKQADALPMNKLTESGIWLTALASIGFTLTFALMLTNEAMGKYSWEKHLSLQAEEWNKLFESHAYENKKGEVLTYQLLKPLNFDSTKKYPLVVCLPYGNGIKGAPAAQVLLKEVNREKYPSFLFVPYGPPGSGWGGVPAYVAVDSLVFDALNALQQEVAAIDPERLYVTGISLGGYGSWNFIMKRPDMFAAAIPVCGGGNPALSNRIKDVSVWAFHGAQDRNVPVEGSRNIIEEMKKAGGNPKYTEYPDAAHNIWDNVAATPGLWDWLFAQHRDYNRNEY